MLDAYIITFKHPTTKLQYPVKHLGWNNSGNIFENCMTWAEKKYKTFAVAVIEA